MYCWLWVLLVVLASGRSTQTQWTEFIYGKVRTDGIEFASFNVPPGTNDVLITLVWSDLHGHVPPVLLLKYGALPTTTSYHWRFNGTSSTYWLSASVSDLHIGEYFVGVWGGALQSSIMDFGIGPSYNVWYHLKVQYKKCSRPNVIGNDCEYLAWPLAVYSTESINMIQNQPKIGSSPFIAAGCFDQDDFYAIYTFTTSINHFKAKFVITASRLPSAQSVYWAIYHNRANFIDASTVPFMHGYGETVNTTSTLSLDKLPAGLWYLVIFYNAPDATSCSNFHGTSYTLSYELQQCTTDLSSMNNCHMNWTRLDQLIANPMKNASAVDKYYMPSIPYISVATTSLTYGIGYSLPINSDMVGARVIINLLVLSTLDLSKVSIVLSCPSQNSITFTGANATITNGLPFALATELTSSGNTLQDAIAQSNLITLTWPHFQPPSIGTWYITMQTTMKSPWTQAFVVETMACAPNMCGAYGTCLLKRSFQGMVYGDCLCAYGHAGAFCDEVIAIQEKWHGWLLIFSNLAIVPPIAASVRRELYAESILFGALGVFSSAYHACDLNWYCALPFSFLMELDFALSYNSILLCLFHLSGVGHRSKIIAQAIGIIVLMILMLQNPTAPGNIHVVLLLGGGQLLLAWSGMFAIALYQTRWRISIFTLITRFLIKSGNFNLLWLMFGILNCFGALLCWFLNSSPLYWLVHSLWHIFAMTAAGAFMSSRRTQVYRILDANGANILRSNTEAKLPCAYGSSLIIPMNTPILDSPQEMM